jgi:uncharacterized phage infection (PIP) family protein YhgE
VKQKLDELLAMPHATFEQHMRSLASAQQVYIGNLLAEYMLKRMSIITRLAKDLDKVKQQSVEEGKALQDLKEESVKVRKILRTDVANAAALSASLKTETASATAAINQIRTTATEATSTAGTLATLAVTESEGFKTSLEDVKREFTSRLAETRSVVTEKLDQLSESAEDQCEAAQNSLNEGISKATTHVRTLNQAAVEGEELIRNYNAAQHSLRESIGRMEQAWRDNEAEVLRLITLTQTLKAQEQPQTLKAQEQPAFSGFSAGEGVHTHNVQVHSTTPSPSHSRKGSLDDAVVDDAVSDSDADAYRDPFGLRQKTELEHEG